MKIAPKAIAGSVLAAAAVMALAATTLPASASHTSATPLTVQQAATEDAQTLVIASEATAAPMQRDMFQATTETELNDARAARIAEAQAVNSRAELVSLAATLTAPGSGEVRYPLPHGSYSVSRTVTDEHNGADMAAGAGTPIFATAAGTVRISSEGYHGYGVAVVLDHTIGGQSVSTLYAHMIYGSRLVSEGDSVAAGQMIGQVGNTGRSFGDHLHYEVRINGGLVEPMSWLAANAS